jgi:hypothetical protein
MNSNRNNRNPQQLRSLIQNMGRSIDEARTRRLGPSSAPAPAAASSQSGDMRFTPPSAAAQPPQRPEPQRPGAATEQAHSPAVAPPVRAANEMFEGGTPRLKARPKRAS